MRSATEHVRIPGPCAAHKLPLSAADGFGHAVMRQPGLEPALADLCFLLGSVCPYLVHSYTPHNQSEVLQDSDESTASGNGQSKTGKRVRPGLLTRLLDSMGEGGSCLRWGEIEQG